MASIHAPLDPFRAVSTGQGFKNGLGAHFSTCSAILCKSGQAAALSSLSAPHKTILSASSGKGRCSAFGLVPWRAHPNVALLLRGQDHRHRLRMDWLDHGIRRRRKKTVDEMRSGNRFRFRAAVPSEFGPNAGEAEQRPAFIEREPDDVLLLGLRSCERDRGLAQSQQKLADAKKEIEKLVRETESKSNPEKETHSVENEAAPANP